MNEKVKRLYNIPSEIYDIKKIKQRKMFISITSLLFTIICCGIILNFIKLWKDGYIFVFAQNTNELPFIGVVSSQVLLTLSEKYTQITHISILYSCIPAFVFFYIIIMVFLHDVTLNCRKILQNHNEMVKRQKQRRANDYLSKKNKLDELHAQAPIVYTETDGKKL